MHDRSARSGPRLADVAARAGVSIATASRVLNPSSRNVGRINREKVRRAAKALDYHPDSPAQTMARGHASMVALVVSDIDDPYFSAIAAGVAESARAHGVLLTITVTGRDHALELESVRGLRRQRPRAILICGSRTENDPLAGALRDELGAFSASGGRPLFIGQPEPGTTAVELDNVGGAWDLGTQVRALGHRRATVVTGKASMRTVQERLAGFRGGFALHGGRVEAVERDTFDREGGYRSTRRLIESGLLQGRGLLCAGNDVMAVGAMTALRDAGVVPGAGVAVTGFGGIGAADDVTPGLSTVRYPLMGLGKRAADRVLADEPPAVDHVLVSGQVLLRGSSPPVT